MFRNKKGGEKIFSIWWYLVLVIVAVSFFGAVAINYGTDINVNELEAKIIYERVANCVNKQGYLNEAFLNENFNIHDECQFNPEIISGVSEYFLEVKIYDESFKLKREEIEIGNPKLENQCIIGDKVRGRYFAKCYRNNETVIYKKGEKSELLKIQILTASNQQEVKNEN